jgi:hypothetical protein
MLRAAVVVVCVASLGGTATAGGPAAIALPPLEVSIGATTPVSGGEAVGTSTEVLVGVHWASLYWKPTSWDIGVGFVGAVRPLRPGYRQLAERPRFESEPTDPMLTMKGMYLTLSRTVITHGHFRTWIELRGELLRAKTPATTISSLGGAVRFAAELYWSGVGGASEHKAIALFAGTWAIGIYVEASHRELALELGPTGFTSGLSIRIPFLLAAAG